MIVPVYKQDIIVDRNIHEIIDFMNKATFRPTSVVITRRSFVKGVEFRGYVDSDGFRIISNSDFESSFAPVAKASISPITENQSEVHLEIGMNAIVAVCLLLFSFGILAIAATAVHEIGNHGMTGGAVLLIILLSVFSGTVVLTLRYSFYSRYKKLKQRLIDILRS